eukprot:2038977-Rhodomonas_salina.1
MDAVQSQVTSQHACGHVTVLLWSRHSAVAVTSQKSCGHIAYSTSITLKLRRTTPPISVLRTAELLPFQDRDTRRSGPRYAHCRKLTDPGHRARGPRVCLRPCAALTPSGTDARTHTRRESEQLKREEKGERREGGRERERERREKKERRERGRERGERMEEEEGRRGENEREREGERGRKREGEGEGE